MVAYITVEASNVPIPLDAGLQTAAGAKCLHKAVAKALGMCPAEINAIRLLKRSVDARKKSNVHFVATVALEVAYPEGAISDETAFEHLMQKCTPAPGVNLKLHQPWPQLDIPSCTRVSQQADFVSPVVVGAGPAGLFAALYLAEAGLRPLLLEQGECAYDRQKAVNAFAQGGELNPYSNIQFGEGGAGTFSDGKLTTGTKSPHIRHVLQAFVDAGAPEEILWQAKPHIGTDLLPEVVTRLRERIIAAGGQVRFNTQVTQLCCERINREQVDNGSSECDMRVASVEVKDVITGDVSCIPASTVVLACGHSARDMFTTLQQLKVALERKPFAMGVRIEHPQKWLNAAQYGQAASHPALGAADYKLAVHLSKNHDAGNEMLDGRGVYTFCMCPGGEVVAAASEEGGVCVNGMSRFARDGENCNSALLVEVRPDDLPGSDPLEGVRLQQRVERAAYEVALKNSGVSYAAPAQTVGDFLRADSGASRKTLPANAVHPTYPRGVANCNLRDVLPAFMCDAMQEALPLLDRKLRSFAHSDAVITAVEARSSSPVRIVRNADTLESVSMAGLYPCGEGAGYAGGIMSAACDGLRVAESICQRLIVTESKVHGNVVS